MVIAPRAASGRAPLVFLVPLLVALLVLAAPELARAAPAATPPTAGRTWGRGARIKVFSQLPRAEDRAVDLALAQINSSGARVKLVRVRSMRGANVLMRRNPRLLTAGLATQGRPARGPAIAQFRMANPYPNDPYQWTMVYVHELGHILGLDHPRSARACTVMNSMFFSVCPINRDYGKFTCRLLQQNDKAALVRLYGGRATKAGPVSCSNATGKPILPAPAVSGFSVVTVPLAPGATSPATWAQVSWDAKPGYVLEVSRAPGACPIAATADRWSVAPPNMDSPFDAAANTTMADTELPWQVGGTDLVPAGPFCFEAKLTRTIDGGTGPVTSRQVTWTPPAPAPAG